MTLPSLQVLLDDGTGTFPYDLTAMGGKNYVLLGPGYSFSRGRDDWQSQVTAGSLTLTLNNADGRFSPGSTIIASPSPIKVDQKIRVKETINAVTYTRFTGYVKSWPVAWPAVVSTISQVQITATDAQARAERWVLKSLLAQEVAVDAPEASYTLGEPAGAVSAADSSGNQAPNLAEVGSGTAVAFGAGTGPGTDGLTAATFAGGQYLTAPLATAPAALEIWFSTTTNDANKRHPFQTPDAAGPCVLNGLLSNAAGAGGGPAIADGLVHQVVWQGTSIYLDGALTGITATALTGSALIVGLVWIGSLSNVIAYTSTLSAARITAHYQAGKTGFAGESGTARITRLAGYASIPLGSLDTSLTNVAFEDTTGKSAMEALLDTVAAEGGVAYINGLGNLDFHNRNKVAAKTAPDLTLDKAYVTADVTPVQDDQRILNYVEATAAGTGVTQIATNAASVTTHGTYPESVSYLVQSDPEALDRANWIVATFAESSTRYGTLTINLYRMSAAQAQTVLAAFDLDTWLRVTSMPSQTPGSTTADVVVQGFTETVTSDTWTLQCNVVSRSVFSALVLDDATLGKLDSGNRLYF